MPANALDECLLLAALYRQPEAMDLRYLLIDIYLREEMYDDAYGQIHSVLAKAPADSYPYNVLLAIVFRDPRPPPSAMMVLLAQAEQRGVLDDRGRKWLEILRERLDAVPGGSGARDGPEFFVLDYPYWLGSHPLWPERLTRLENVRRERGDGPSSSLECST